MKTANPQNDGMTIEASAAPLAQQAPARTLSVVAGELEAALAAQKRIPVLREELLSLTGRRRRAVTEKKADGSK